MKLESKKNIQYCENSMKMYMILRCEFVKLSFDELNLKVKFFIFYEGSEREATQSANNIKQNLFYVILMMILLIS